MMVTVWVACAFSLRAETTLVFGFDNNTEPNGIQYLGVDQLISFSGGASGYGTDFNLLSGTNGTVNFSIGAVGDLSAFSGSITSIGGAFNIGGNGGGIDGAADTYVYFETGEAWEFTFSEKVRLTAVDYWGPDAGQQTILVDNSPVAGSPFDTDFSASIIVPAGQTLTFGHAGTAGNYALNTFTVDVIPEPATFLLVGVGGLIVCGVRRSLQG